MKRLFRITALTAVFCSLYSCNTFIGLGKDFQRLGQGMENKGHGRSWNGNPNTPQAQPTPTLPPSPAQ